MRKPAILSESANPFTSRSRIDKIEFVRQTHAMRALAIMVMSLCLLSCDWTAKPIPSARETGEMVVVTRNGPTTYYEDAQEQNAGIEHDLVMLFAKELGLRVKFVTTNRFSEILPKVKTRQVHFAAAGLTMTDERKNKYLFSTPYQTVQQQLVYNTAHKRPKDFTDVIGKKLEVVAGSSYVEQLKQAQRRFSLLKWKEVKDLETEDLLAKLSEGEIDFVIADSHIVKLSQNFHPNIAVGFDIGRPEYLAWAFPRDGDAWLYKQSVLFFAKIQRNGTLKRLHDRYYGHIERLEHADVLGFLERMNSVLPKYKDLFQEAQVLTGIDWRMLAALAYQESKWNPLATSPTNVRGIMMLTEQTADHLGVSDRLDPIESIPAGSKYLRDLRDRLPPRIPEPDRTWMALASYNVGFGHLEDARVLAQRQGLNPDSWTDLKKTLPLLAKSAYHSTVKHGFARGGEPVIFTENIRTYYDILLKFEEPYRPMISPFGISKSKNGKRSNRDQAESFSMPPI